MKASVALVPHAIFIKMCLSLLYLCNTSYLESLSFNAGFVLYSECKSFKGT